MPDGAGSAEQSRSPVRRWLSDLSIGAWSKGVVAVLLAGTAAFGGLDTVEAGATEVAPGDPYSDGALNVTVKRATLVSSLRAGERVLRTAQPGQRYLAVVAAVANPNTSDVPLGDELDLRGVPAAITVGVFRLADGTALRRLGPGLADDVAFVWQVPEGAVKAGETVTVRLWDKKFQELTTSYGKAWIDNLADYGQVEVPVAQRS